MRIVRFHLEPWQRCGSITPSPAPSPSIAVLSPHVLRRQRPPSIEDFPSLAEQTETLRLKALRDQERKMKNRYPQSVKKLTTLCSDVLVKCGILDSVNLSPLPLRFINHILILFIFRLKHLPCNRAKVI